MYIKRIEKLQHKGKAIIFFNYRGLNGDSLLAQIKENTKFLLDLPYSGFLTISDYTDTYGDKTAAEYLRSEDAKKAADKTKKKAVLGLSTLKTVFLNMYGKFTGVQIRAFDDVEKAKEYLVS